MKSLRIAIASSMMLAGATSFIPGKVLADSARLSATQVSMNSCWADCPLSCCAASGENCVCGCSGGGGSYCNCDAFRP